MLQMRPNYKAFCLEQKLCNILLVVDEDSFQFKIGLKLNIPSDS